MARGWWPVLVGLFCGLAGVAQAGGLHRGHRRIAVRVPPTLDAGDLALLAPPARPATANAGYGDAAYARGLLGHAPWVACDEAFTGWGAGRTRPCTSRATADLAATRSPERGEAFTPAFLAAPQILTAPPGGETRVLPPATVLPLAVDDALHRH